METEKLYYSIGDVAEILGESTSLVRFWTNSFSKYIKPHRNAKGNRLYLAKDVEFLKELHYLIKQKGMTLEGAAKTIAEDRKKVSNQVKVMDTLKDIRAQLVEVKKSL